MTRLNCAQGRKPERLSACLCRRHLRGQVLDVSWAEMSPTLPLIIITLPVKRTEFIKEQDSAGVFGSGDKTQIFLFPTPPELSVIYPWLSFYSQK